MATKTRRKGTAVREPTGRLHFKVNGEEFTTNDSCPTANEILLIAENGGVIPGDPKDYVLDGEKHEYKGSDRIDLDKDNTFVTIPVGPTPVASRETVEHE